MDSNGVSRPDSLHETAARVGLSGCSKSHLQLLRRLFKMSKVDVEILMMGPTGVGKELYSRFVHQCSPRASGDFVALNCGAVPDELFENELFGHAAGAYTGAPTHAEGLVAAADGGTLFLDEVDALSPSAQVKLLRLLQEKEYRRLGETKVRRANLRLIAATNSDLAAEMEAGQFREDLFFRLRVVPVEVPALRHRQADVPVLLNEFVRRYAALYDLPPIEFDSDSLDLLERYDWPGNVRELENCVRSLVCQQLGRPIQPDDLLVFSRFASGDLHRAARKDPLSLSLHEVKLEVERDYIVAALRRTAGNITQAAGLAGKHRRAFWELMRKHGIDAAPFKNHVDRT